MNYVIEIHKETFTVCPKGCLLIPMGIAREESYMKSYRVTFINGRRLTRRGFSAARVVEVYRQLGMVVLRVEEV